MADFSAEKMGKSHGERERQRERERESGSLSLIPACGRQRRINSARLSRLRMRSESTDQVFRDIKILVKIVQTEIDKNGIQISRRNRAKLKIQIR